MNADRLLSHYERIADAPDAIARLRRFIIDLAVRGKLVAQDPMDEPASELLNRIGAERARLVKTGKIKKTEPIAAITSLGLEIKASPGWTFTNLQSVCASITDGDHLPPPKAENGIPFLVIGNVRTQQIDFAGSRFVPVGYYEALDPIRRPRSGDLLYTLVGSYGIPVVVRDDRPFCVQRHIGILRPSKLIDVGFLARIMESQFVYDQATACATGIAQKTVPLFGLRRLSIPLPPLAEQHRIVAKVDELMALCDRLEAAQAEREATRHRLTAATLARLNAPDPNQAIFADHARIALDALPALTTRPNQIKQVRQTILNLAVRGKLVPQDPRDQAAPSFGVTDAFEFNDRLEVRLPIGWNWTRVADVADAKLGKMLDKAKNRGRPYRYLRNTNIHWFDIRLDDLKRLLLEDAEIDAYRLRRGDVLICEGGHGVGRTAVWAGDDTDIVFQKALHRVRPGRDLDAHFFSFCAFVYFHAEIMQRYFTGVGIPHFTGRALERLVFPLPPFAEQRRIVAKVDELMACCDRLEASLATGDDTRRRLLDALLAEALAPAKAAAMEAVA